VHQIHSTDVLVVGAERWTSPGAPRADALVTDRPGVALGVMAADCAPVLFADSEAQVIGAAHAGWKGALGGVVDTHWPPWKLIAGAARGRDAPASVLCPTRSVEFPAPFSSDQITACSSAARQWPFMFDRGLPASGWRAGERWRHCHDALAATDDFQLSPEHARGRARLRPGTVGDRAQRLTCPT
jgi:hypothetical protein